MSNQDIKNVISDSVTIIIPFGRDLQALDICLAYHNQYSFNNEVNFNFILTQYENFNFIDGIFREILLKYKNHFKDKLDVVYTRCTISINQAIKNVLNDPYKHISKYIIVSSEKAFPLDSNWLKSLMLEFRNNQINESICAIPLINNNPIGFKFIVNSLDLKKEFDEISCDHIVGRSPDFAFAPYRMVKKGDISDDGYGTVYNSASLAYWIHQKTTLNASFFSKKISEFPPKLIKKLTFIHLDCVLFEKATLKNIIFNNDDKPLPDLLFIERLKAPRSVLMVPSASYSKIYTSTQRTQNQTKLYKEIYGACTENMPLTFQPYLLSKSDVLNELKELQRSEVLLDRLYDNIKNLKSEPTTFNYFEVIKSKLKSLPRVYSFLRSLKKCFFN